MENQEIKNTENKSFFQRMTKTNRIIMIVSYSIIAALILATILLACIPTYTGVKFADTPDRIEIKTTTERLYLYADDDSTKDDFYKVWNAYNSSSSPVVMDAIFNGYMGKGKTAVYDSAKAWSYSNLANDTTYSVAFVWEEEDQMMTDKNGDQFTYKLSNGTNLKDPIYFDTATFAVSNVNKVEENKFYLRRAGYTSTSTRFYYTAYVNFADLYAVLDQLHDNGKFSV